MSLKSSMRAFDRETDRIAEREDSHFEEHGRYSECAGCGEECNPSNIHADGRKFCDLCWLESDENNSPLSSKENRAIELSEKWKKQMCMPVVRHTTRENYMRYAEKEAIKNPVVSGCSSQTYQIFMCWYGQDFKKTLSEVLQRRKFVHENWNALKNLITSDLSSRNSRDNRCPKRLRDRCDVDDILSRFNNWNPNSHTDMKALEYLQILRKCPEFIE